jgi:hypothetical protein
MQAQQKRISNFFERISLIIDYYSIRSVKSFACDYLGYNSSQKINRLKAENANPSYEILNGISNKFENISPEWLLTGKGSMLRQPAASAEPNAAKGTQQPMPNDDSYKEKYFELMEKYSALQEKHLALKEQKDTHNARYEDIVNENERLKTEIEKLIGKAV